MKYQIKNGYTNEIIVKIDATSLREAVEKSKANLRRADLRGADLRRADLREANLFEAILWGANLRGADLRRADLGGAKIRVSQKEEVLKSLGIIIAE